jgi:predicted AlkP superfamily pyrophosphatase or phosphodiesterase
MIKTGNNLRKKYSVLLMIISLVLTSSAVFITSATAYQLTTTSSQAEYTIIILIDGLRTVDINATNTPNICELAEIGVSAEFAITVLPSVTFAAIPSLVTGAYPDTHGVPGKYYDKELDVKVEFALPEEFDGAWREEYLEAQTIFERAKEYGLKTAAITGYMVGVVSGKGADVLIEPARVQYYDVRGFPWDYEILPIPDWFKEILAGPYLFFPPHPIGWHEDYFWDPDEWLTNASLSVLENFMPNVLFLHLPMLDLWEHFYGPGTPIAIETLKHADEQIGRIVDKLEELGIYEQTSIFVTSDHGFTKVIKYADLETPLQEAGIEYIIANNGGSVHFYFTTSQDKLRAWYILWGIEGVDKVIPRELAWFWHLDHPRAGDLIVFLEEGYSAIPYVMGMHGSQELTDVRIPIVMAGAGIKVGVTIPFATIIDIVPTACYLLGIPAPAQADGYVLWLALEWESEEIETVEALVTV